MIKGTVFLLLSLLIAPLVSAEPGKEFSFDDALKRLGHDQFKERVAAQAELREWGQARVEEAIGVFYKIFRSHEDPEIRLRCRELLKELVLLNLAEEGEGYIGVKMMDQVIMKPGGQATSAVRITEVMPETPAEKFKLKVGDLVTGIDEVQFGRGVATVAFGQYVRSKKPEEVVTLHLLRNGEAMKQKVELMRRPPFLDEMMFLPFGQEFVPPDPKKIEEDKFREWLKKKAAEDAAATDPDPELPEN